MFRSEAESSGIGRTRPVPHLFRKAGAYPNRLACAGCAVMYQQAGAPALGPAEQAKRAERAMH